MSLRCFPDSLHLEAFIQYPSLTLADMHCSSLLPQQNSLGVAPGKESRVEELLKPVVAYASSSKEPGTLTYRLNRSLDGKTIVMYEEYENAAGLEVSQLEAVGNPHRPGSLEGIPSGLESMLPSPPFAGVISTRQKLTIHLPS